jgi:hypothetical protein
MTVLRLRFTRKKKRNQSQSERPKTEWWWATRRVHLDTITRRWEGEHCAGIIYETVKEMIHTGDTFFNEPALLLRLAIPKDREERYYMELCLHELGIELLNNVVHFEEEGIDGEDNHDV